MKPGVWVRFKDDADGEPKGTIGVTSFTFPDGRLTVLLLEKTLQTGTACWAIPTRVERLMDPSKPKIDIELLNQLEDLARGVVV